MTTLEALRAGRAIIADPGRWTAGAMFASASGRQVDTPDKAEWFCAVGAIRAVTWTEDAALGQAAEAALDDAAKVLTGCSMVATNDRYGQIAALQAYDDAIRTEEAREAEFRVAPEPVEPVTRQEE